MNRALFSGVTGLRAHQQMMEVIGNNVANVNTTGYKAGRAEFADTLSQLIRVGTSPGTRGPNEPSQIGLGVRVIGVGNNFSQGSLQNTGRLGDVAIQGDGWFLLKSTDGLLSYTRAGAFNFGADGYLADITGQRVQGWPVDATTGTPATNGPIGDLQVDAQTTIPAQATQAVRLGGNLPADATVNSVYSSQVSVYDTLGVSHPLNVSWTKDGDNTWHMAVTDPTDPANPAPVPPNGGGADVGLTFDASTGKLTTPTTDPTYTITFPGAGPQTITIGFGPNGGNPLQQFGGANTAEVIERDGSGAGQLRALAIGENGDLIATFSNGVNRVVGRMATALFPNNSGLEKIGDNHWRPSPSSGLPQVGSPGVGAHGQLVAGALEGSNVDLSQEFTNLIIAQRGFQANSKIVTASDELLSDLINIRR